jgi:hypothetical protein
MRIGAERTASPCGAAAAGAAAAAARRTSSSTSRPAVTSPLRGASAATRSMFVMSTCVSRLRARRATRSASNAMSGSPARTSAPAVTSGVNPSPLSITVSSPMWITISSPAASSVTACPARCTCSTRPSHGATSRSLSGSTEMPSPASRCANAGSGTSSSGTTTPVSGATSVSVSPGAAGRVDVITGRARRSGLRVRSRGARRG